MKYAMIMTAVITSVISDYEPKINTEPPTVIFMLVFLYTVPNSIHKLVNPFFTSLTEFTSISRILELEYHNEHTK